MNYLKEILAFHTWLETNQLDPAEQALWFHLMDINNKCGWAEWFAVANITLQARLGGIDRKTLDRKRMTLINKGRIEYKNAGKREAGKYRIIAFEDDITGNIPVETGKNVPNDVPKTSLKEGIKDNIEGNFPAEMSTLNKQNKTKQEKNMPPISPKIQYAEFVALTNAEYEALMARLGSEARVKRCIEILDNYKGANPKKRKYVSDYRAILSWVISRLEEEEQKAGQPRAPDHNKKKEFLKTLYS